MTHSRVCVKVNLWFGDTFLECNVIIFSGEVVEFVFQ